MNSSTFLAAPTRGKVASAVSALRANPHLWLAILLAIPAMLPIFAPGYFMKAHDARHSIFFLVQFDRSFSEGALWPVWGPDHAVGFGYPTFLLYAPLAFYVGEFFHLLGFGFAAATKATWVVGFLLGATGSYRLARRWFSPTAALIASLAFTYAPYHLSQIYVRAALAEFMALSALPWVVYAFLALWDDPRPRRAALGGLALAALMLFHTVSTLTFIPLTLALLVALFARDVVRTRRANRGVASALRSPAVLWTLVALVFAGLLTCIFIVPMLLERGNVAQWQWVRDTYNYRLHFVYPGQLLDPAWGYGYSVEGPNDGMSFQVGWIIFLLAAVGAGALLIRRVAAPRLVFGFLLLVTLGAILMMMPVAAPVWDLLPLVDLIQFPWRLLSVAAFTLALLAGLGAAALEQSRGERYGKGSPFLYVVGLALVVTSLAFARPEIVPLTPQDESPLAVIDFELTFTDMRGATRWAERPPVDADSPLIAQYLAGQPLQKAAILEGSARITQQEAGALWARAQVQADEPAQIVFYNYYFPGWRVTVNGQPAEIRPSGPNGLITLDLPSGTHDVRLRFGSTPPRVAGALLSGVGLLGVMALFVLDRRRRYGEGTSANLR
jgi:hypothetical protein